MLPVLVFSRTGCVLCAFLPVSAIFIRHWLNNLPRSFFCVASSGLFQNWVPVLVFSRTGNFNGDRDIQNVRRRDSAFHVSENAGGEQFGISRLGVEAVRS